MTKKGLWSKMARLIMLAAPLLAASMPAHAQLRDAMAMPVVEEDSIMTPTW